MLHLNFVALRCHNVSASVSLICATKIRPATETYLKAHEKLCNCFQPPLLVLQSQKSVVKIEVKIKEAVEQLTCCQTTVSQMSCFLSQWCVLVGEGQWKYTWTSKTLSHWAGDVSLDTKLSSTIIINTDSIRICVLYRNPVLLLTSKQQEGPSGTACVSEGLLVLVAEGITQKSNGPLTDSRKSLA